MVFYILGSFVVTASFKGSLLASLVNVDLEPRIETSEVSWKGNKKDETGKNKPFKKISPFSVKDVLSSGRSTFMPGAGTLYSDLKDSPYKEIRDVMARIKGLDNFVSVRQLNNDSFFRGIERGVFIHHKEFGKAYGYEIGKEVLFDTQQVE